MGQYYKPTIIKERKVKSKATIKYTDGVEITLEGYAGEDIATIIKALQ